MIYNGLVDIFVAGGRILDGWIWNGLFRPKKAVGSKLGTIWKRIPFESFNFFKKVQLKQIMSPIERWWNGCALENGCL